MISPIRALQARFVCPVLALLLLPTAGTLLCQAQSAASTPITLLLPAAAHAPAPAWVKPGLRLTYYTGVASVRGNGLDWKLDKDGRFVDPQGNHWSGDEKQSIGGHGYIQYDIVALDSGQVALQQSSYLLNLQEPLSLLSRQGLLGPPGTGGDLWVAPTLLKRLPDGMHAGFQIYRAPYRIGNTTRGSVWIHQDSRSGSFQYIYDSATGVLLHYSSAGKPQNGPVLGPNESENTSNVLLFQSTLAEQRMLKLPWMGDDIADWTAHLSTLRYQGVSATGSPGVGSPPIRQSVSEIITPQSHSRRWAFFTTTFQSGGLSHQVPLVGGSAQIGALWIAPQTLSHLQPGQEIDRDPITRAVTRVGRSSQAEGTVISEVGATYQLDFHYDLATGHLIGWDQTEHHPYVVKRLEFALHH